MKNVFKYLILLFFLFYFISLTFVNASLLNGSVDYYSFDNGTATDISGYNNNGTLLGTLQNITGKLDDAFFYNGINSSIKLEHNPLNERHNFTISVWIKTNKNNTDMFIFDENGRTDYGGAISLRVTSTNKIRFWNIDANNNVESSTIIQPNVWYFITAVNNGTCNKIYINGNFENENCYISEHQLSYSYAYIGYSYKLGGYYNGIIDDLSIWNRILNNSEIQESYNNGNGYNFITNNIHINFNKPKSNNIINKTLMNITITTSKNINKTNYTIKKNNIIYLTNSTNEVNNTFFNWNDLINLNESGIYNLSVYVNDINNNELIKSINFIYDIDKPNLIITTQNNTLYNSATISINGYTYDNTSNITNVKILETEHNFNNIGNKTNFTFVNNIGFSNGNNCIHIISYDNVSNSNIKKFCFSISQDYPPSPFVVTSQLNNWINKKGYIDNMIPNFPFININTTSLFAFRIRGFNNRYIVFDNIIANLTINNQTFNLTFNNLNLNYETYLLFDENETGKTDFYVITNDSKITNYNAYVYVSNWTTISGIIYTNENKTETYNKENTYILFIPFVKIQKESYLDILYPIKKIDKFFEKILSNILNTEVSFMNSYDYTKYKHKSFYAKINNDGSFSLELPLNFSYAVRLIKFNDNADIKTYYPYDYIYYTLDNDFDIVLNQKLFINKSISLQYIVTEKDYNPIWYSKYILWIIGFLIIFGLPFLIFYTTGDLIVAVKVFASLIVVIPSILTILQLIGVI